MAIYPVSVHPTASGSGLVSYLSLAAARASWVSDTGVGAGDEGEIHIEGDWTSALDDSTVDWVGAQGPADVLRVIASPENYAEAEWNDNKWGLDCSDTASSAMTGADTHIELYGLQIRGASAVARGAWNSNAAGLMIFDGCHFSTALGRAIRVNGPTTAYLRNFYVSGGGQYPIHCDNSSAVIVAHNFVVRGASIYGVYGQNGSLTVRNGIVEGAATADFFGTMTREYCASGDATATGTGCIANRAFSFASATSGVLSPSDESGAIGGGVDLSADATLPVIVDIFGNPYLSPPSMGLNEAGTSGGEDPIEGTLVESFSLTGTDEATALVAVHGSLSEALSLNFSDAVTGQIEVHGSLAESISLTFADAITGTVEEETPNEGVLVEAFTLGFADAIAGTVGVHGSLVESLSLTGTDSLTAIIEVHGSLSEEFNLTGSDSITGTVEDDSPVEGELAETFTLQGVDSMAGAVGVHGSFAESFSLTGTDAVSALVAVHGSLSEAFSLSFIDSIIEGNTHGIAPSKRVLTVSPGDRVLTVVSYPSRVLVVE